jgi:hypothetical protein
MSTETSTTKEALPRLLLKKLRAMGEENIRLRVRNASLVQLLFEHGITVPRVNEIRTRELEKAS